MSFMRVNLLGSEVELAVNKLIKFGNNHETRESIFNQLTIRSRELLPLRSSAATLYERQSQKHSTTAFSMQVIYKSMNSTHATLKRMKCNLGFNNTDHIKLWP